MLKTIVATTIISLGLIGCSNANSNSADTSEDVAIPKLETSDQSNNTNAVSDETQESDIRRLQEQFGISEEEARSMLGSVKERADDLGQFNADRVKAAKEKVRVMREAEKMKLEESLLDDGGT